MLMRGGSWKLHNCHILVGRALSLNACALRATEAALIHMSDCTLLGSHSTLSGGKGRGNNCDIGVAADGGARVTMERCTLQGMSYAAIVAAGGSVVLVRECAFPRCGSAVVIEDEAAVALRRCALRRCRHGRPRPPWPIHCTLVD
jgi:hypothetical protein